MSLKGDPESTPPGFRLPQFDHLNKPQHKFVLILYRRLQHIAQIINTKDSNPGYVNHLKGERVALAFALGVIATTPYEDMLEVPKLEILKGFMGSPPNTAQEEKP